MNVASLELCKELYELSGWLDTYAEWLSSCEFEDEDKYSLVPNATEKSIKNGEGYPAYDLGYLLRKLPKTFITNQEDKPFSFTDITILPSDGYSAACKTIDGKIWLFAPFTADTPEDAACLVAIELFQQDVLKRP